jgi:hypothetical protein
MLYFERIARKTPLDRVPWGGGSVAALSERTNHLSRFHDRDRDLHNVKKPLIVYAGDASIDAGRRVRPALGLRSEVDAGK